MAKEHALVVRGLDILRALPMEYENDMIPDVLKEMEREGYVNKRVNGRYNPPLCKYELSKRGREAMAQVGKA